jgi:hypothetical protein
MHEQTIPYSDPQQRSRSVVLPLLSNAHTFSYPKEADQAPKVQYYSANAILTRAWTTDAHFSAYSVPSLPYHLSRNAVMLAGGVCMVAFLADVNCDQSHKASGGAGDSPVPDDWWLSELVKLTALRQAFPGALIYRTKGGIAFSIGSPRLF